MTKKIKEILREVAADTSKIQTSSNTDRPLSPDLPGEPGCPHCGGVGYLRLGVPLGHPDFGKVKPCVCLQGRISARARQRLFALSNLEELQHLTFESFDAHGRFGLPPQQAESLERAYNQAQHFAQNLNGWLLLQGRYGSGKTHLAAAIANFAVSLGVPTLFITVPDMLDSLRYTFGDSDMTFEQHFEEIRQVPLLVLDDFGTQNATPWAQEKLFQILNYRYIKRLPLVVTMNLALNEIEARISSRLKDPELVTRVTIIAPDYRDPTDDVGHEEISSLALLAKCTFGNFSDRHGEGLSQTSLQDMEKAFRAAREFAEHPRGWLVLIGPYGCGKTHLAAAIANYRTGLGNPPLFVMVPDLLDHLRATYAPNSTVRFDRLFEEVRTASLLILDDLGAQNMTPWVREKLIQLINYRYIAELPTVFTTADRPPKEWDERIYSRCSDKRLCKIYAYEIPAYRGTAKRATKGTRKESTS
ncbi:MAG: ATP-binding protein [Anaerolineales bacterium]|nr:ATP-binding protein [Anaerolineales bacterium]